MPMNKILSLLQSEHRWRSLGVLVLFIVATSTLLSLLARFTLLQDNVATRPRVAVVGPLKNAQGAALRQGAALYLEVLNKQGGHQGRLVELLEVEESADAAKTVLADKRVVAVIGHLDPEQLKAAAPVYASASLPLVTPLPLATPLPGVTGLGLDPKEQARFAANYARNIQQQRLMYVVRESGAAFDPLVEPFLEVYKRFETPVREVWTITPGADADAQIKKILDALKDIDIGAVYVATQPELAARLVKGIRDTGNVLEIFGPAELATGSFVQQLKTLSGKDAAIHNHGIIAATPVLFDTANEDAQRFQTRYQQKFSASPDWLATYAYDAAKLALAAKDKPEELKGIMGSRPIVDGMVQIPIQMGLYNGDRMISAPAQLLPIAKGASFNYIEALRQGRVLYVNDRFMFKTNVVYVGVTVNEVSEFDPQKETATLDMSIWFRYRGNFSPQDLEIHNAITPVKFETPEESKESDDVQYRRYRIKEKFRLNFANARRAYGQHVAGISFRHKQLNRNNLTYVVDVLGMPTGNALIDDLHQRKVVKSSLGWDIDNAWISQDIARERGDGAPQYVGMTGEQPFFSTITLGLLLKPAMTTARDIIPGEYFIYIAIFGLFGTLFALMLDVGKWWRFWAFQSWMLRLIFTPLLLLSAGNLLLDWAFTQLATATTAILVYAYESLWWVLLGWLLDQAIRRFVWETLEKRADRKVPNVIKFFVSMLTFALALAAITAFVFNQPLTSLLATSGVLVMVVGLAIQANIANVFSGIVLNIERPFKIGDIIRVNNLMGTVVDITWRTTRILALQGHTISLANSKVSEALLENFSQTPNDMVVELEYLLPAELDPKLVLEIIHEALGEAKSISKPNPKMAPFARYKGVVCRDRNWVGLYWSRHRINNLLMQHNSQEEIWLGIRKRFLERGLPLLPDSAAAPADEAPAGVNLSKDGA